MVPTHAVWRIRGHPVPRVTILGLILIQAGAAIDKLVRWWVPAIVAGGFVILFVAPLGRVTGAIGPLILLIGSGLIAGALSNPVPTGGSTRRRLRTGVRPNHTTGAGSTFAGAGGIAHDRRLS